MDPRYIGPPNRDVPVAQPGEWTAPRLGPLRVWPPVILAPMAGITNPPYRALCRNFGAGLYVSEMITARALLERNERTLRLAGFLPEEEPRSLQLYGVDPSVVGEVVGWLTGENMVDHIDLNFGCPVRKVTRRGGGAAVPAKPRLLAAIARAAVARAGTVPVTLKFRIGIDERLHTHLEAGRIASGEGCAAVSLHARTAQQMYAGEAQWHAIAELVDAVDDIPVFGNGDIWEAWDALRMMRTTGCHGVVVGRGCLGRPWLFRDLARVFDGLHPEDPPCFGEVTAIMREHAQRLCAWLGARRGMRDFRKHATWYTKGFPGSSRMREKLIAVETLLELQKVLAEGDPSWPFPANVMRVPRGKSGGQRRVVLPDGYLDDLDDATPPAADAMASAAVSGG